SCYRQHHHHSLLSDAQNSCSSLSLRDQQKFLHVRESLHASSRHTSNQSHLSHVSCSSKSRSQNANSICADDSQTQICSSELRSVSQARKSHCDVSSHEFDRVQFSENLTFEL